MERLNLWVERLGYAYETNNNVRLVCYWVGFLLFWGVYLILFVWLDWGGPYDLHEPGSTMATWEQGRKAWEALRAGKEVAGPPGSVALFINGGGRIARSGWYWACWIGFVIGLIRIPIAFWDETVRMKDAILGPIVERRRAQHDLPNQPTGGASGGASAGGLSPASSGDRPVTERTFWRGMVWGNVVTEVLEWLMGKGR